MSRVGTRRGRVLWRRDAADGDEAAAQLALLRQFVERRREALADLEVQLATLPTEPAQHAESLP